MVSGRRWKPCGLGQICITHLCYEVSIQGQSEPSFVSSSFSCTLCSPSRGLALVPITLSTQMTWVTAPIKGNPDLRAP